MQIIDSTQKIKNCFLEISGIFIQVFLIQGWLYAWMQNPQIQRANNLHLSSTYVLGAMLINSHSLSYLTLTITL